MTRKRPISAERLRRAYATVASLKDPVYAPILERLADEIRRAEIMEEAIA